MNCVKPDHPCYVYTYPPLVHIDGFGKRAPDLPSIQSVLASSFIPISSIYGFVSGATGRWEKWLRPAMKSSGRRFDTFRYKGLG